MTCGSKSWIYNWKDTLPSADYCKELICWFLCRVHRGGEIHHTSSVSKLHTEEQNFRVLLRSISVLSIVWGVYLIICQSANTTTAYCEHTPKRLVRVRPAVHSIQSLNRHNQWQKFANFKSLYTIHLYWLLNFTLSKHLQFYWLPYIRAWILVAYMFSRNHTYNGESIIRPVPLYSVDAVLLSSHHVSFERIIFRCFINLPSLSILSAHCLPPFLFQVVIPSP